MFANSNVTDYEETSVCRIVFRALTWEMLPFSCYKKYYFSCTEHDNLSIEWNIF